MKVVFAGCSIAQTSDKAISIMTTRQWSWEILKISLLPLLLAVGCLAAVTAMLAVTTSTTRTSHDT